MEAATKETFPEANLLLKAPPGEEDRVNDLAVHRYEAGEEGRVFVGYISRWQPTEEERAAIAAGGPVWVSVWGQGGPPPIAVFGTTPFQRPEVRFSEQSAEAEAIRKAVSEQRLDTLPEELQKFFREGERWLKSLEGDEKS